jgi:lipoprotein-anchoring transpeptidase ErfK/SrfK
MKTILTILFMTLSFNTNAAFEENLLDELDPSSPDIEEKLQEMDEAYLRMTGEYPFLEEGFEKKGSCYRNACPVWSRTSRDEQLMYVYIDGAVKYVWLTSTGTSRYSTHYMDQNPSGRIYDRYTSTKYPEGDYNGLGNMPYAVFIKGGYAIHGTTRGNWPKLGKPASHGCIRLHPDNGLIFNRLVRSLGVGSVWVTVD